jgi:hypothetical protein
MDTMLPPLSGADAGAEYLHLISSYIHPFGWSIIRSFMQSQVGRCRRRRGPPWWHVRNLNQNGICGNVKNRAIHSSVCDPSYSLQS